MRGRIDMEQIEFDVELSAGDLYAFLMRHTYTGISGIFGLFLSFGSWLVCALRFGKLDMTARIALFVIGCLFTIVQPVMLYSKARNQARQNKNINASIHYAIAEDGITVSQGEQEVCVKWYEVRKMVRTKRAVYLYMSPVRAFIFPESQCGEQFAYLCEQIAQQLQKYKNYDIQAEQQEAGEGQEK